MTQQKGYTTFEASNFKSKTLSDCSVLIVDDEQSTQLVLGSILGEIIQVHCLSDSMQAVQASIDLMPDLIILDLNMPNLDGITLCNQIKSNLTTAHIPIIFITASVLPSDQDRCWEAGAADFIAKPIVASTLLHRVKNILQSKLRFELLTEQTFKDQLTGVFNRHYLMSEVPTLLKVSSREKQFFGVVMIDIDFFKGFNDTYGHVEGDKCLKMVAKTIQNVLKRPQDIVVRYGGEEFVVFLPNTPPSGCKHLANKIKDAVFDLNIKNSTSGHQVVTISGGYIVTSPTADTHTEELINQADEFLFKSKTNGRNQIQGVVI